MADIGKVDCLLWVGSVSSPMREAAARLLEAISVSSPPHCGRRIQSFPTAALADEGAFVFDKRMAGYGAEPTPERPTDDGVVNLPRVRRNAGGCDFRSEASRRILGLFGEFAPGNEPCCKLFAIQ